MNTRLSEIRSRRDAATPAPWVWRWPLGPSWAPELVCPRHGLLIVMDAVRLGMSGAVPRFAVREPKRGGLLHKLTDLMDKPHRDLLDCRPANNPDADFMSNSRSDMDWLIAEVDRLSAALLTHEGSE